MLWTKLRLVENYLYFVQKYIIFVKNYTKWCQDTSTMMKYDVQVDVEIRKVVPYTDPLKHPENRKHVYKPVSMFTVP